MMVLITYDVSVTTDAGKTRLRKVAKQCVNFGQRVQNSVFECEVTPDQSVQLKAQLKNIYDAEMDSLRFYMLGKKGRNKVEHYGAKVSVDPIRDTLIL